MNNPLIHAFELFIGAIFAITMAFVGNLTRLFHEHVQGEKPLSVWRIVFTLPAAVLMGVIGTTVGIYLHETYGLPEITGGALGGALGYIGPSLLDAVVALSLRRYGPGKDDKK